MLLKQGEALNVQLSSVQENLSSEPVLGQLITALKNKIQNHKSATDMDNTSNY